MEAFDYLAVLISIVLGLGITQLLAGFGRWLEQRATVRAHAPAVLWAAFLLLAHIQTWWSMFGLRHGTAWTFVQFFLVLLQPILLYLLAHLVFPLAGGGLDLRGNFVAQRRWFFGTFLLLLAASLGKDLVRHGRLPDAPNLAFHGVLAVIGGLGLATGGERAQHGLAWAALLLIGAYIALLFPSLA